jgi:hypothetical protein
MQNTRSIERAAGAALLVPGMVFLGLVGLGYLLNVQAVRQPFDSFSTAYLVPFTPVSALLNGLIILGPVVAVVINLVPFVKQNVRFNTNEELVTISITRSSLVPLAIMVVGPLMAAIFFGYFLTENWQCLIGATVSC